MQVPRGCYGPMIIHIEICLRLLNSTWAMSIQQNYSKLLSQLQKLTVLHGDGLDRGGLSRNSSGH